MDTDKAPPADGWWPNGVHGISSRMVHVEPGVRIRLIEAGPPDGAPAVLLHGWACSAYSYRFLIPELAGAGFRVYVPDLMGHGFSDKPRAAASYSSEILENHAAAIIRMAAGDRKPFVAGHSMGGGLVLRLALKNPEWFRAMALIAPVGLGRVPVSALAKWMSPSAMDSVLPKLVKRPMLSLVMSLVRGSGPGYEEHELDEYWAPTADPNFLPALRSILHSLNWSPVAPEQLAQCGTPTLVIQGEQDRLVRTMPPEWQGWRVLEKAGAELVKVPGAGHVVHEERPQLVRDRVLAFARRTMQ